MPRVGKVEYPDYIDLGIHWYKITDDDREALKFEKDNPRGVSGADMPADQAATSSISSSRSSVGCPKR